MGRVNYGHKLLADSQHKGIRTGVCVDLHFHLHWKQYPLDLQDISQLDFQRNGRQVLQHFTDMIFSWTTPLTLIWI